MIDLTQHQVERLRDAMQRGYRMTPAPNEDHFKIALEYMLNAAKDMGLVVPTEGAMNPPIGCPKCGLGEFSNPSWCPGDHMVKGEACRPGEHLHQTCRTCAWTKTEPCKDAK